MHSGSTWREPAAAPGSISTAARGAISMTPPACSNSGRPVRLRSGHGFYWPEIGRFISQDPIGDGVNWYAYVGNNPVTWVDPEGLHETASTLHNMVHGDGSSPCAAKQGLAAFADGFIPGADPFKGHYDRNDPFLNASLSMGGVTRNAMLVAIGASAAGRHRLPPNIIRQTGVPRKVAGRLHQDGVRVPHLNLPGNVHAIVNRYNWYKPWKWFARGK